MDDKKCCKAKRSCGATAVTDDMSRSGDADAAGAAGGVLKYVVPGAVGALSLMLARRWGGVGPAAHVPPTGVSRRRRLATCRDPPIKRAPPHRPVPVLATPGPRSPMKLGSEDDNLSSLASGNRRPSRIARSGSARPGLNSSEFSKCNFSNIGGSSQSLDNDAPSVPKHVPFPNIPQDYDLVFELMMFLFTSLAAGAQFLNLYRTVWWLPHSYTSETMNFYLIDTHVVLFILIILGRRFILSICTAGIRVICPANSLPFVLQILNVFVLCTIIGGLSWCIYNLFPKHPILSMFFLCYPVSIYFLLFGMRASPLLQLESPAIRIAHCCASGAPAIRNEVELLKTDYNYRLKQIIFSSLIGAYYASFIPWCFSQHFLHYDVYQIIRHLALVWLGLFTQHASHSLSARYCDQLHRAALHLGRWVRKSSVSSINLPPSSSLSGSTGGTSSFSLGAVPGISSWSHNTLWADGSSVRHGRWTYTSVGCVTAAEPGNMMHFRFYTLFYNPSNMLCALLCMQITLVILLLTLLIYTTEWHFILSLAFLLLSNYYTLFKLIRDYLITWRVYQMECRILEKNSPQST